MSSTDMKQSKWIPLVVAMLVIVILGLVGLIAWLLATSNNSVINAIDPQPNLSADAEGYDAAYNLIELTFTQDFSPTEVEEICGLWNSGMDDMFVDEFFKGMYESGGTVPISNMTIEQALRDYMTTRCGG